MRNRETRGNPQLDQKLATLLALKQTVYDSAREMPGPGGITAYEEFDTIVRDIEDYLEARQQGVPMEDEELRKAMDGYDQFSEEELQYLIDRLRAD